MKRFSTAALTLALLLCLSLFQPQAAATGDSLPDIRYNNPLDGVYVPADMIVTGCEYIIVGLEKDASGECFAMALANYDGERLALIPVEVTIAEDPGLRLVSATDGMLWTAETCDFYDGEYRYALSNHSAYLNVDTDSGVLRLDADSYRARWIAYRAEQGFILNYKADQALYYFSDNYFSESKEAIVLQNLPVSEIQSDEISFFLLEAEVTPAPPSDDNRSATTSQFSPSTTLYVLNTNTMKFHYPDCKSVKKMSEKNKSFFEGTRDEVIAMGYTPCGNCHP